MGSVARLVLTLLLGGLALALLLSSRAGRQRDARDAARAERARDAAADSAFADTIIRAAEDMAATITVVDAGLPAPERDPARIAHLLATRAPATYLGAMLAARDSVNYRWRDRVTEPIRIWVQDPPGTTHTIGFRVEIEGAFRTWLDTGIPVDFRVMLDSSRADVHVTWVDRYESLTSGRTRWVSDLNGWIIGGGIELAVRQPDGSFLEPEAVLAIAIHEVGHLLGLDHSPDERDVMAARVRVRTPSEADRRTIRLVYDLPPGSVRAP